MKKNIEESYKSIDSKIDLNLLELNNKDKQVRIKAMIAYCEGRMNNTINVAFLSIAYTLVVSGLTMSVFDSCTKLFLPLFFALSALVMLLGYKNMKEEEFKLGFVYKILCFKLEELVDNENNKKKTKKKK